MRKNICLKIYCLLILLSSFFLFSCKDNNQKLLILWTDNTEFASYVELFNLSQNDVKFSVVYKSDLLNSLPVAKGETNPDIIVGSYIAAGIQKKQFKSLNSIFDDDFTKESFYSDLLKFGKKGNTQLLLPVSFNLGALVFDSDNLKYIDTSTSIDIDGIKEISKNYNSIGKDKVYRKMAFAPQWNPQFLYKILNMKDVSFSLKNEQLTFNIPIYENTCAFLNDWTTSINTSLSEEKDFAFKYLYTPFYKQILQQKSLFSYSTSNKILSLPEDELNKIDFRWFVENDESTVEEDIVMMGIYKKSKNKKKSMKFIRWFMDPKNQEKLLQNRLKMNLDTSSFGIANGFSSLIEVNEKILPVYYKTLLAKTPSPKLPKAPKIYTKEWIYIKDEIILPQFLLQLEGKSTSQDLTKTFTDWVNSKKEE